MSISRLAGEPCAKRRRESAAATLLARTTHEPCTRLVEAIRAKAGGKGTAVRCGAALLRSYLLRPHRGGLEGMREGQAGEVRGTRGERGQKSGEIPVQRHRGPRGRGGASGGDAPQETARPPGGDPRTRRADARPPPLGGWVLRSIRGVVCAGPGTTAIRTKNGISCISSKRDSFRAFSRRYTWEQDEGLAPRSEIAQTAHLRAGPGPRRKYVCACF